MRTRFLAGWLLGTLSGSTAVLLGLVAMANSELALVARAVVERYTMDGLPV